MPRLQPRKKSRLLFLIAGAIVILFLYFSPSTRLSLWMQDLLYRAVSPVSSLWRGGADRVASLYRRYFALVGVQRQNELLKSEGSALREENLRLKEDLRAARSGTSVSSSPPSKITARVVAYDPADPRQSLIVDKGGFDRVRPDDVVLAEGALVGRVLKVTPRFAQILLLTDPDHSVGVMAQDSRAKGIVMGLREKLSLNRERYLTKAEYLSGAEEMRTGDLLLTSGVDGVFPKGIPVGEIRFLQKDGNGLFWSAEVEPRAELSKLEFVQILGSETEGRVQDDG